MKLSSSFFAIALVAFSIVQCDPFDMAVLGGLLSAHNQRIYEARENLRNDAEIVKKHDLKLIQAEIDKKPHKFEWRVTKAAMLAAQGDEAGAKLAAREATSTQEYASYSSETRQQIAIARVKQVRDSYPPNSVEYSRTNKVYCESIRIHNEDYSPQSAQRYDLAGC